jgi:2-methylisocitrate lyase-like PEP mutase family enzyme
MWRTVQAFEQAGVAAIHIEDHEGPGKHTRLPQKLRSPEDAAVRRLEAYAKAGAAIVLYYGLSTLVQFDALQTALETFRRTQDANAVTGYRERIAELEDFLGYPDYVERAKRLGK